MGQRRFSWEAWEESEKEFYCKTLGKSWEPKHIWVWVLLPKKIKSELVENALQIFGMSLCSVLIKPESIIWVLGCCLGSLKTTMIHMSVLFQRVLRVCIRDVYKEFQGYKPGRAFQVYFIFWVYRLNMKWGKPVKSWAQLKQLTCFDTELSLPFLSLEPY